MERTRWTLTLLAAFLLAASSSTQAWAAPPPQEAQPSTPDHPPVPPAEMAQVSPASSDLSQLPPLKAVLVVGPIDGADGPATVREKANMELVATEMEASGVAVFRFYAPDDDWDRIQTAARGAHLFLYRGHGVYWGEMATPPVGGLALTSEIVSPDDLRQGLELAPNAIVMLYGCFTAGSSSLDAQPVTSQEAQRRVAQYSDPFFDIGVAGYYADWFGDAFQIFVRNMAQGLTLGEAYEAHYDFSGATVERYAHPDHPGLALWLDKDEWEGTWQYNNAFAGLANQTLMGLFALPELEVVPPAIAYLAGPDSPPREFSLTIGDTGHDPLQWTAEVTPDVRWLAVFPGNGSDGPLATVVVDPSGQGLGSYQAAIEFTADDPTLANRSQTVPVALHRVAQVYSVYLPMVAGRSP